VVDRQLLPIRSGQVGVNVLLNWSEERVRHVFTYLSATAPLDLGKLVFVCDVRRAVQYLEGYSGGCVEVQGDHG
jgi:hypothetical protein